VNLVVVVVNLVVVVVNLVVNLVDLLLESLVVVAVNLVVNLVDLLLVNLGLVDLVVWVEHYSSSRFRCPGEWPVRLKPMSQHSKAAMLSGSFSCHRTSRRMSGNHSQQVHRKNLSCTPESPHQCK
jgi:hypothetical protein